MVPIECSVLGVVIMRWAPRRVAAVFKELMRAVLPVVVTQSAKFTLIGQARVVLSLALVALLQISLNSNDRPNRVKTNRKNKKIEAM